MNNTKLRVLYLCRNALERVDQAICNHEHNVPEDLSLPILNRIRNELLQMLEKLSPSQFRPTYGRFILDWPDEHGLIKTLSDVEYEYERIKE